MHLDVIVKEVMRVFAVSLEADCLASLYLVEDLIGRC